MMRTKQVWCLVSLVVLAWVRCDEMSDYFLEDAAPSRRCVRKHR